LISHTLSTPPSGAPSTNGGTTGDSALLQLVVGIALALFDTTRDVQLRLFPNVAGEPPPSPSPSPPRPCIAICCTTKGDDGPASILRIA
jgi:hypothetical protein